MNEPADYADLIARYLAGRVSASEAVEFEELCARQPDLARQLEDTLRLRSGLATLRDRGELEAAPGTRPRSGRWMPFGIAATLAALAVGAVLWIGRSHTEPLILSASPEAFQGLSGTALSVSATYRFVTNRSANSEPVQIPLPARRAALELRLLPENRSEEGTYRVTLSSDPAKGTARAVGTVGPLHADSEDFVRVFVDTAAVAPGRYEIVVEPVPADSANAASRFKLVLRPTGS